MYVKLLFLSLLFAKSITLIGQNIFSNNQVLQEIYTLTYNRKGKEILPYFSNPNPQLKKQAYLAFASIQDTQYLKELFQEIDLNKDDTLIKYLVYSIGQTKSNASFEGLLQRIHAHQNDETFYFSIEAIGKTSFSDLTHWFAELYHAEKNKSPNFIRFWTRGLYHAKRNKHIETQQEAIKEIYTLLLQDTTLLDETKKLLSTIFQKSAPKAETIPGKTIDSFEDVKAIISKHPNIYEQNKQLQASHLTSEICAKILYSDLPSLLKYTALSHDLSKNPVHLGQDSMLHYALHSKDISLISLACSHIQQLKEKDLPIPSTVEKLTEIQSTLNLPKDLETWLDLEKTIHLISNQPYTQKNYFEQGYENPLDWDYIKTIPNNQKVSIHTTKGIIILKLHVEEAPASVAHFLKLVDSGYYDEKYFHRVVPNFVIQGGCPRGDGWGSLNWIQRSEFSNTNTYKPGSIGLASAGKDTEGVQFFITHTYTTNLDGKYTVFGEVEKGLQHVNSIVIGDKIISIKRL